MGLLHVHVLWGTTWLAQIEAFSIVIAALQSSQQQMQTQQRHSAGCPFLLLAHLHVNTSLMVSPEGEHLLQESFLNVYRLAFKHCA